MHKNPKTAKKMYLQIIVTLRYSHSTSASLHSICLSFVFFVFFSFIWLIDKICSGSTWRCYHFTRMGGGWNSSCESSEWCCKFLCTFVITQSTLMKSVRKLHMQKAWCWPSHHVDFPCITSSNGWLSKSHEPNSKQKFK